MRQFESSGYTEEQVVDSIKSKYAPRTVDYRFQLVDYKTGIHITDLVGVESCSISFDAEADIKRTGELVVKQEFYEETKEIDYQKSKLVPYFVLVIGNDRLEYRLGEFNLSTPKTEVENGSKKRSIQMYDDSIILLDNKLDNVYRIKKGVSYDSAIEDLLSKGGAKKRNVFEIAKKLEVEVVFDIGTTYADAINNLLSRVNFVPIHVDSYGFFSSFPYVPPSEKPPSFEFDDGQYSIMFDGVTEELDMFRVPNKFVFLHTNVQKEVEEQWKVVVHNRDINSPTSFPNVGRTIMYFENVSEINSREDLVLYANKVSKSKSQVFGKISFVTAVVPNFEFLDVIRLSNSTLDINDNFLVTRFKMDLKVGGKMSFEAKKVVDFDVEYE